MYPVLAGATGDFELRPSTEIACKIWWTDPANGEKLPVFAGLPFLSWSGSYGIHGPVDNYRAADGGTLRRGFVSHGCIRMRGADVLEVYARIKGIAKVPVHVQREPERKADGRRIDVPDIWLGAECVADTDCSFTAGGFCKMNPYSERGYCSSRCTAYCPDKTGEPTSFCVKDPDEPTKGMCVLKEVAQNTGCRNLDHLVPATATRFGQTATATVCLPGSRGWVGDHCFADADCKNGTVCKDATTTTPGLCTMTCTTGCADQAGWPTTFCTTEAQSIAASSCVPASGCVRPVVGRTHSPALQVHPAAQSLG